MEERLKKLQEAVADLEVAVKRQDLRIAALEGGSAEIPTVARDEVYVAEAADPAPEALPDQWPISAVRGTPALVGRSLLILAGAFLLRALTEAGTFANGTGVVLGLAYAASWIIAAAMAARKGARGSAGFFAVCAALIADPLIFEASTEFAVLSPTGSAVMLTIMTAAGLFVASRWRLQESAWVFVVGAMVTAATLAVVRPPGEAATAVLVVLGLAAVWLAGRHGWEFLRWLTAVGADVGVLRLTAMATAPGGPHGIDPPNVPLVVVLQAALLSGYVGSSCARAVRGKNPVRLFDYLQTAAAWAIGWGGAVQIARTHGSGISGLSAFALLVGLAAYAGAFGVVDRRFGRNRSFVFLSSLGLVLVLLGLPGTLGSASAVVWAVLALIAATAGSRWDRVTLRAHAAVLLGAAWVASGVAVETAGDLSGRAGFDAVPGAVAMIVAFLTVITTLVVLFTRRLKTSGWVQRLPLTALLVMSGIVAAATLVSVVALVAPGSASWMGTVALSALTIVASVLASRWGIREAGWIVYPLLALTGFRVIFSDLASGRTVVFVIALAAYGAAMIASPKILRSGRGRIQSIE
jgi:hypothetical protein